LKGLVFSISFLHSLSSIPHMVLLPHTPNFFGLVTLTSLNIVYILVISEPTPKHEALGDSRLIDSLAIVVKSLKDKK
jgi:hypothetical protein